ncbi:MAG: hypothetical protein HKN70_05415 [Gammaproteobacteria bacterium]|nr:hypothetical protein [Gammaproteobacteria bacterium]
MTKETSNQESTNAAQSAPGDNPDNQENVDKIRDILFGGQMRDYEQRFREMEEKIAREIKRLSENVTARFDQIDKFMKTELNLVNEKLLQERKERKQDGEDLDTALGEARKAIENRIADVEEVHGAAAQEMRNRMHEQANELLETIRQTQESLESNLGQETRRLRDEKVAREDLAGLFTEVAMRLQRDFDLPDKQ